MALDRRPGKAARASTSSPGGALTREEFARRFQSASARLRCVAFAIVGDRAEADDLVQEAAVVALTKLSQYREGTNFNAWMTQIVRFTALNAGRLRARRDTAATDPAGLERRAGDAPAESPPIDAAGRLRPDQESFDDSVVHALEALDETARACLLLRTTCGLSYQEISEQLDIPQGTAMSHVHRSRRRLREALADHPAARQESET